MGGQSDRSGMSEGTHHFYHDPARGEPLTTTIVFALAEVRGTDPMSLGFALEDFVDTDALDAIGGPKPDGTARDGCRVELTLPDLSLVIDEDGHIVISDVKEQAAP